MWEAALSFLGLGVQPPDPSFGSMLREAQDYLSIQPWLAIVSGLAVSAVILGLNLLGDAVSDYYELAEIPLTVQPDSNILKKKASTRLLTCHPETPKRSELAYYLHFAANAKRPSLELGYGFSDVLW